MIFISTSFDFIESECLIQPRKYDVFLGTDGSASVLEICNITIWK